jgi:microcystin-dependent protein
MSQPFLGQIEVFGFGFPPRYWAACAGQIMAIAQNQALFSLLGTTYGGNGVTTFALPDLRSRVAVGVGADRAGVPWTQGQTGGQEGVTLTSSQIPAHIHTLRAASGTDTSNNTNTPDGTVGLGVTTGQKADGGTFKAPAYVADPAPAAALHASAVGPPTQGGQPHENRMPALAVNFCISLAGVFPSRN